jgi:hypothetical protein
MLAGRRSHDRKAVLTASVPPTQVGTPRKIVITGAN